jgi:uncharacterized protein (DUF1501 family)
MKDFQERDSCIECNPNATPISRRAFLRRAAILSASGIVLLSPHAWAARSLDSSGKRRLIVVFLRGAVDGLNVVVPHGEPAYYDARPTIAIGRTGANDGVIDLDGHFGLHPALASMEGPWRDGTLAFVHACGSPDPTRSHFDAQDFMESGTPGVKSTQDGWLNRALAVIPGTHSPTEALSLGPTVPRILSGRMPVANLALGRAAERPMPMDNPVIEAAFDKMYVGNDSISRAYRDGRQARMRLVSELTQDMAEANAGAPSPQGFSDDADRLARLIGRDPTIRVAFMALGGWDTHVNEGAAGGQLGNLLGALDGALAAIESNMGGAWRETVVAVVTEFGRTARINGTDGTDHGTGTVALLVGGALRGGSVIADWPGLKPKDLHEDRDLKPTTDLRSVLKGLLRDHLRVEDTALASTVFPDSSEAKAMDGLIG